MAKLASIIKPASKAKSRLIGRVRKVKKEKRRMDTMVKLLLLIGWVMGIVLANGFWSTLFSVFIAPYAWYLVVEKIMILNGWL